MRKIIHIDMDAFFASIEQRDNEAFRGKPLAVGGSGSRGVVAAASYEARKFGVHSAMSSQLAVKKCPHLIFTPPRFHVYKEVSNQIRSIFLEYTDLVEPLSLDEAFLDVTTNHKNIPYAIDVAKEIKQKILERTPMLLAKVEHIDVLINNAGYLVNKPFEELSHRDFARSYQVNVIGVMQTVQTLLPKMERGAHIVNISSMGGFQGTVKFPGLAAYSTSKAALVSFTELFAEEFKHTEIKMNCLCLGAVQTEMLHEAFPGYEAQISPEQMAAYICNFALTAHQWMHGRVIPVSLTTP